MDNYEDNIESIKKKLDEILGIGNALKSFGKGLLGKEYTKVDAEEGPQKLKRDDNYSKHVRATGSEREKRAAAAADAGGSPSEYKIGNNFVKEVSRDLAGFLYFETDKAELESSGKLIYVSNKEKSLKVSPSIEWLYSGSWTAKKLSLSGQKKKYSRGGIKGRLINFVGEWESGTFMGIISSGKIVGGQIVDGYYIAGPDGYKIKPWDFKSGGFSISNGFVMGLRMAKENSKHKKLSIIQVKQGLQIKVIDNNDKEHLIKIDKGIDYTSLDMKINGVNISWENYNRTSGDFEKSYIQVGSNFSIPGVVEIDKGVQSIEVKTSDYEKKEKEGESKKSSQTSTDRFDVKTKRKGWQPKDGKKAPFYLMDFQGDTDAQEKFQKFKKDINSGFFFKNLTYFKKLVEEGRVDGYGNYPSLAFIFPKQKGEVFKDKDSERDTVMSYLSDFRKYVINNFKTDSVSQYYMNKIKSEINSKPKVKKKKRTSNNSKKQKNNTSAQNTLNQIKATKNESLSISSILKKII